MNCKYTAINDDCHYQKDRVKLKMNPLTFYVLAVLSVGAVNCLRAIGAYIPTTTSPGPQEYPTPAPPPEIVRSSLGKSVISVRHKVFNLSVISRNA